MNTAVVRILIADDQAIVREGLKALLERQVGWSVVAEACNGQEAVALYRHYQPDVVLMGARRPQRDGLDALKSLLAKYPQARIILISAYDEQETIYQAIRAGAKSFLLTSVAPEELLLTIAKVAAGETCISPYVSTVIAECLQHPVLTPREMEVLRCLVAGKNNQEISQSLFIAEGTVKVHVASIFKKMGVSDRTKATTAAVKRGIIPLL